jgi:excisionase family DNA binding protein
MRQTFVSGDTVLLSHEAVLDTASTFARREIMVVQMIQDDVLLTFKEAMSYLRVSRSTLYRLMWSGQLTGHKVGSTWRFYREDLRACVGREISTTMQLAISAAAN